MAGPPGQRRAEPDFAAIHEQLQTHKHVTLQLLWEEHIEAHPDGYRYSRPARPRKPRDKAKVEAGVQLVERWILAALRHRRFTSLAELNQAIAELLERLNQRPFRKRSGPCPRKPVHGK